MFNKPELTLLQAHPRKGKRTAKENGTSRTFVFKVPNARLFATVHVGTPVYANFSTKQVPLDGKSVCCQIIRTNTPSAASRSNCDVQAGQGDCWGDLLHSTPLHVA